MTTPGSMRLPIVTGTRFVVEDRVWCIASVLETRYGAILMIERPSDGKRLQVRSRVDSGSLTAVARMCSATWFPVFPPQPAPCTSHARPPSEWDTRPHQTRTRP